MSGDHIGPTDQAHHADDFGVRPPWFRILAALVLVLGALVFLVFLVGIIADLLFVDRYLPSRVWLETMEPFAMMVGATVALSGTSFLFLGFLVEKRRPESRMNDVIAIVVLIAMVFLLYFLTANLIRRGLPAMIAVAWGEAVEHPFVIDDVDVRDRKNCHRPIVLRDMPVTTTLCEMPQEFRAQLHPGMSVVFVGKGPWMGLFVEDFRKP